MPGAGQFDLAALRRALGLVPPSAWSLPSTFAATGVHHGYRRVTLAHLVEPFAFVLDAFAPVHDAWLSCIDPGGFIVPHRDAGPYRERWQVPIATAGTMTQGDITAAVDGCPFRVEHWAPHSVDNGSDHPRIHLVIDRDVILDRPAMPFALLAQEAP
jgi:hypothetical protein